MRIAMSMFLMAAALVAAPAPADAFQADPGRSVVTVQAPTLAPGAIGTAPLYGEMRPNGGFVLHAPVSQAHTGNAFQERLLRQFVPGSVSLAADSPVVVRRLRSGQTMRALGTVYAAGTAMRVPLFIRMYRGSNGTSVRTFFKLPLSAYGIQKLGGGNAGDVRVAIEATFKN